MSGAPGVAARIPGVIGALGLAFGVASCHGDARQEERAPSPPVYPTFSEHVAPILHERCSSCHRPDGAGPFSLITYDDVSQRAGLIAAVTRSRRMPPWLPVPGFGEFADERRLDETEIATIQRWAANGAPEGDPRRLPETPVWVEGWHLGQPDLVIRMPEPYELGPDGAEVFRNFVIPIPVGEERYVRAVELRPGNARAVHHAVMMLDETPTSRRLDREDAGPGFEGMYSIGEASSPDGFFLGWTPGRVPAAADGGLAWRLDRGTDMVLQLHLRPTGETEAIQAAVGFWFTDEAPRRSPSLLRLGSQTIDIPAGRSDYFIEDSYVLPVDVDVLGVYPHAHYLGKTMLAGARLPDGSARWLLRIDSWDFNWQGEYRYAEPIHLPAGTELWMRFGYDNSDDNPLNPSDPPVRVVYGPASTDEMGDLWIQVLPEDSSDLATLNRDFARKEIRALSDGFEMMTRLDPLNAQARHNLGLASQSLGDTSTAVEQYREAIAIKPDYAASHNNLGTLLLAMGSLDSAIVHFRAALSADPEFARAAFNLGGALERRGDALGALEQFSRAVELDHQSAEGHFNLGNALQAVGRAEEAIEHLGDAVAIDPRFSPAHYNLANLLADRGRIDEAVAHYREAIRWRSGFAAAHNNLGMALEARGDLRGALSEYRLAVEADPRLAPARANLAGALAERGDLEGAIVHLEELVRLDPDDSASRRKLAHAYESLGRDVEAVRELRRLLEAVSEDARARHDLGVELLRLGRTAEGLAHLREAARLRPDWTLPHTVIAWTLATHPDPGSRDPSGALSAGLTAARLSGYSDPLALDALAAAYASSGEYRKAGETARRALKLAQEAGALQLARNIAARLQSYGRGRPFRDEALGG